MIRLGLVAAAVAVLGVGLAGCASARFPAELTAIPSPAPLAPAPELPVARLPSLADLPGWADEDHLAAFAAYRSGCSVTRDPALTAVCAQARRAFIGDDVAARRFFETRFRPEILRGPGLLTAYFAPNYPARDAPDVSFSASLRSRPSDLVLTAPDPDSMSQASLPPRKIAKQSLDGVLYPYPDRTAIELTPPVQALAWVRPEDLFFLQIQGSGTLVFPDGRRMRAVYDSDNGRPFVPIAPAMVRQGLLGPNHASGEAIRTWLAQHRGPQAQALMDLDPRYVFFRLTVDDGREPAGAAGVALPAGRALAIDPSWRRYGELYWIDAVAPTLAGAVKTYRRLVLALDTGSAIKGEVRADLYLGRGEAAGLEAGRVRHSLYLVRLVPVARSASMGSSQDETTAPPR